MKATVSVLLELLRDNEDEIYEIEVCDSDDEQFRLIILFVCFH